MSTLTSVPAPTGAAGPARGLRLGGMNWLVWRQHRAAFWTLLAATVAGVLLIAYERTQLMSYLDTQGWPHLKDGWDQHLDTSAMDRISLALGLAPVVIGVFLGAPLLANDLETGTAKLVNTQSSSRVRWLVTKLGITVAVTVLCTTALSLAFGWWWAPLKHLTSGPSWDSSTVFDNTGPVPVALTLFTVVGGVAIGMLLRRTLMAMVVTFGFGVATQIAWAYERMSLGHIQVATSHNGVLADNSFPVLPGSAHMIDQFYLTASGDYIGYGNCHEMTASATNACLDQKHVVGWAVTYLNQSQMPGMQWLGAGILLALTAALAAFILLWGRKRLV
ncbi:MULTISPECIES: ABC transporter permease [Streptacidiphilus]|uniref:ABC transporter permease n=1 Tax=Streptacidiphilus cavernicola TaxID=3342716 RepID=A0ABV6UM95_9ACTN|nr:ABC transporter permease [Streptacidiphilus jeojiense]